MSDAKKVYVIGHRNPDTDSICSAIAYAELKRTEGVNAVAARAGQINEESKYALEYFGVDLPVLVADLYPRVKDIMLDCGTTVKTTDGLRYLGQVMHKKNVRSVPVVDENDGLKGIVTVSDMAKRYFEELNMENLEAASVTIADVASAIDAEVLAGEANDTLLSGTVSIAAGKPETVAAHAGAGDVVIAGDRVSQSMKICLQNGPACLILTHGSKLEDDMLPIVKEKKIVVLSTKFDTFTTARLINQAVPVGHIMNDKVMSFTKDEMLSNIKGDIEETNYRNYPVLEGGKLIGLISRDNLMIPDPEKVILVDHNERTQAVEGIENAKIIEIIDHHRLGGLKTGDPIYIREDPVGCTSTIITEMYLQRGYEIPKKIAGVLMSAIISDTVLFKSPTCTERDKAAVKKLAEIAGVDYEKYGMDMLKAGSGLGSMTPAEVAKNDNKEFQIGDYRMLVSQISVMDPQEVLDIKADILDAMRGLCESNGYDMSLLMVTDILKESTELFYVGSPKTLIGEAFKKDASGDSVYLPGVMSRKKQIIPPLTDAVQRIQK